MLESLLTTPNPDATPIHLVRESGYGDWLSQQPPSTQQWLDAIDFCAKPNTLALIPGADHTISTVVAGADPHPGPWSIAALPAKLPAGDYSLATDWPTEAVTQAALGWALAQYRFVRYRHHEQKAVRLCLPAEVDLDEARAAILATGLVRDLINTPANDMMPEDLAAVAAKLAGEYGGQFSEIVGTHLLEQNFPMIHAVGRASAHPPRLLELNWNLGNGQPRIAIVGKGICFDSGGLDIKPSSGMRLMKKDMGGAAHALGLAQRIMAAQLPVQLQVLIAAAENAVAGNAFRPGDIIKTRSGAQVEIDNTDAEGRLVLCDALTYAGESEPELIIDFATLTGAARVAVGTEIAAMFCNDDTVAAQLSKSAVYAADPVWQLPLHQPYRSLLDSQFADMVNSSSGGYAGAITAALFLEHFIPKTARWVHFDVMAWNTRNRPGRPEGGEAMGLRATFHYLQRLIEEPFDQPSVDK